MQLFYAFTQYLKDDLGLLGAMVTYVHTKKKNWKRSVQLNLRPLTALILHRQQELCWIPLSPWNSGHTSTSHSFWRWLACKKFRAENFIGILVCGISPVLLFKHFPCYAETVNTLVFISLTKLFFIWCAWPFFFLPSLIAKTEKTIKNQFLDTMLTGKQVLTMWNSNHMSVLACSGNADTFLHEDARMTNNINF